MAAVRACVRVLFSVRVSDSFFVLDSPHLCASADLSTCLNGPTCSHRLVVCVCCLATGISHVRVIKYAVFFCVI